MASAFLFILDGKGKAIGEFLEHHLFFVACHNDNVLFVNEAQVLDHIAQQRLAVGLAQDLGGVELLAQKALAFAGS